MPDRSRCIVLDTVGALLVHGHGLFGSCEVPRRHVARGDAGMDGATSVVRYRPCRAHRVARRSLFLHWPRTAALPSMRQPAHRDPHHGAIEGRSIGTAPSGRAAAGG